MSSNIEDIINIHGRGPGNLIQILQDIQAEDSYLSVDSIASVSEAMAIPESRIYGVATFYKQFKFIEPGEHMIKICQGTACHVKGSTPLLDVLESYLAIKPEETTEDGKFSLERVACLGCCALAPVMVVDNEVYGKMTQEKIGELLDTLRNGGDE